MIQVSGLLQHGGCVKFREEVMAERILDHISKKFLIEDGML